MTTRWHQAGHSGDVGISVVSYILKDVYNGQVAPGTWWA